MIAPTITYGCPCCDGRIDEDAPGVMFCLDCEWRSDEDNPTTLTCPRCGGPGELQPGRDPQNVIPCPRCHGRGEVSYMDEGEVA